MNLKMCEVELYPEQYEDISQIRDICEKYDTIKKYAIRLHDRDIKEDGTPKKPHYHVFLHFGYAVDISKVATWFSCAENHVNKIRKRWDSAMLYLVHKNALDKYQYSVEDVVASFDYAAEVARIEKAEKAKVKTEEIRALATSVMLGDISLTSAIQKLSLYEFNPSAMRWLTDAYQIRCRSAKPNRNIDVILIYGKSGTGKTSLAKLLCENMGKEYYVSSSANDSLQDYGGENALILDDVREYTFEFVDWLKVLDNHTSSSIRSRFRNKVFLGDMIIITTSQDPCTWFSSTFEERWQFFRRVNQYLHIEGEKVVQYNGFINQSGYPAEGERLIEFKNPIYRMYNVRAPSQDCASAIVKAVSKAFEEMDEKEKENIKEIEV